MGEAIGQVLPLAIGVAISPLPIVAMVLMLVTARGRVNGPAFLVGWLVGLGIVGVIVIAAAGGADANDEGQPATWVGILQLLLGAGLLLVGLRQWKSRPAEGEEPPAPKWMGALDSFTAVKALGAGVVFSGLNPKNLLLAVAAATAIAQTGSSTGDEVVAYIVFMVIASLGVGIPVALYFVMGERSRVLLQNLKTWMGHNNAVIMAVMLLVIGAKLIGDGIGVLSA
jgi:threonine/homoserine/homoserine lactone efflux protein